jgi:hypothetical protein
MLSTTCFVEPAAPLLIYCKSCQWNITAASAFSDLVLAVYPLFTIYHLQMTRRLKIGLGILLSLGIMYAPSPFPSLTPPKPVPQI